MFRGFEPVQIAAKYAQKRSNRRSNQFATSFCYCFLVTFFLGKGGPAISISCFSNRAFSTVGVTQLGRGQPLKVLGEVFEVSGRL